VGRLKALLLMLLAVSTAAVLSAGTLAAYNQTIDATGTVRSARMVFKVNGSGEETQSLGACELQPGGSTTFDIVIDTAGTEVGLDVALKVNASGSELPPGLSVCVDGEPIGPSGTGSCTRTYPGMDGASRTVPVIVQWNATTDELMKLYEGSQNFKLDLSATVTATQADK